MLQLFHEIGLSGIVQSDWSGGSSTVKQNLRILPDMVIGMWSQYHNNSSVILFFKKNQMTKFSLKKISYFVSKIFY